MEGMQGKTNVEALQALEKLRLRHQVARRLTSLNMPAPVCSCWANLRQLLPSGGGGNRGVSYLGLSFQWKPRLPLGERWGAFRA